MPPNPCDTTVALGTPAQIRLGQREPPRASSAQHWRPRKIHPGIYAQTPLSFFLGKNVLQESPARDSGVGVGLGAGCSSLLSTRL